MNNSDQHLLLAPETDRKACHKLMLICIHRSGWNLESFIKRTQDDFDGIIVINHSVSIIDNLQLNACDNLLVHIKPAAEESDEALLYKTLSMVNSEWFCLMNSNEIFYKPNYICEDIRQVLTDETAIYQLNHMYLSGNGSEYLIADGRKDGISCENRIYHTKNVLKNGGINLNGKPCNHTVITPFIILTQPTLEEYKQLGFNLFTKSERISCLQFHEGRFRNYCSINEAQLRHTIDNDLEQISEYFLANRPFLPSWGLYEGEAGIALLLAQFYLKTNNEKYLTQLFRSMDHIIERANANSRMTGQSCCDLAGVGWLLCYLSEKNILEIDNDYFSEIDSLLEEALRISEHYRWSYRDGRLAIVQYFMQRGNKAVVENELALLNRQAEKGNGEFRWVEYNTEVGDYCNTGLEHGMAGILHFLGKCYEQNIGQEIALELGNGIIALYKNMENTSGETLTYPHIIPSDATKKIKTIPRFAWCYGAPGILYSIYLFCLRTNNPAGVWEAKRKLAGIACERSIVDNKLYDAMICYGTTGLVQIYNRMYLFTREEIFRAAAIFWLKVSAYISKDSSRQSGYKFWIPDIHDSTREVENDSLLKGLAGVGLVYLSSFDYEYINWDQIISLC